MAIHLEEVAYVINGILKTGTKENGDHTIEMIDPMGDVCLVCDELEARGEGKTEEEAKKNLAEMMRGKVLTYDVPIMWKSHTEHLRIPPTLV